MPLAQTVQNSFIAGLKTEFTGLNFPENAATDTQNCIYTLIGDVTRRSGINYETNFVNNTINVASKARSSFRWLNAGGDGQTQLLVEQIGNILYFFQSSNATDASPLSTTLLSSTVDISAFIAQGSAVDTSVIEVQYSSGNGYLFVFHPNCDPFYCTYNASVITATVINIQIRDLVGIPEPGVADNFRPNVLSDDHNYNIQNQGWTSGTPWTATTAFQSIGLGGAAPSVGQSVTMSISSQTNTTAVTNGSFINFSGYFVLGGGPVISASFTMQVTSYVTPFTIVTGTVTASSNPGSSGFTLNTLNASAVLISTGFVQTWKTQIGNYPSNSDIWWLYKNTSNAFAPSSTIANVQQAVGPAPKGSFILSAFNQDRGSVVGLASIQAINTLKRPSTGAWYAGRVWYAGINDSFQALGDAPYTTWTENVYFSQIVQSPTNFNRCYQQNDPTAQDLSALLPSDGGVITIQGCGAIYKLFALRFGLLVFAANGIWFISGSTGVGFSADDFTVTPISNFQTISGTSFINVNGYPMFWNQEGIYQVTPSKDAGSAHSPDIQLDVANLCLGSILTYYANIPLFSKNYARGDYHMLDYVVQWCFRSTPETGISDRYSFDTILCYNVATKAFYPYSLPTNSPSRIVDIKYIQNPGNPGNPEPTLKYTIVNNNNITFAEENDIRYVDFFSENNTGYNFISYFVSGYTLPGQALKKIQIPILYMFSRNPANNSYGIRAIWDYAGTGLSGKFSTRQVIQNSQTDFTMLYRKIRLRGRGMAVQIKVDSQPGQPFDLMGWSILDQVNQVV